MGGRFLVRIEDIDATRSRTEFVDGIFEDLAWLGFAWEEPVVFQSARLGLYADAIARLRAMGLLYPCFCTRAEIAASLSAPHGEGDPVYPGTCRHLAAEERERRMAVERYAWRLDMARAIAAVPTSQPSSPAKENRLTWHDERAGDVIATPEIHGDVILARKDAPASYHLAVILDDASQGITHVVRGRDLFAATHVHRLLQALLGLPTPVYHHHRLLTDEAGEIGLPSATGRRRWRRCDWRGVSRRPRRWPMRCVAATCPLAFGTWRGPKCERHDLPLHPSHCRG